MWNGNPFAQISILQKTIRHLEEKVEGLENERGDLLRKMALLNKQQSAISEPQTKVKKLIRENGEDFGDEIDFPRIVGKSQQIRKICRLIGTVAKTESSVLIQGESGTGKEVVAQTIHYHSLRAGESFVKVNCAALSETLLESELFGHVKGAFTGALKDRKGRFRQANGGTILLDEIGALSLLGQAKLLRILQEREFEPVGSSQTIKTDVRVISITNVNLPEAVKKGRFREDLFYRLNVINFHIAPLRERREDIPLLAQHFLNKYTDSIHKKINAFAPATLQYLLSHSWPGNVRELENALEHAVVVESSNEIQPQSLPWRLSKQTLSHMKKSIKKSSYSLRKQLEILEKQIVLQALKKKNGVRKAVAEALGIDPRNLNYFLKKHNITVENVSNGDLHLLHY
ncbi:MAG: sigma-54 interaction domain-containing protein [bacterium]